MAFNNDLAVLRTPRVRITRSFSCPDGSVAPCYAERDLVTCRTIQPPYAVDMSYTLLWGGPRVE